MTNNFPKTFQYNKNVKYKIPAINFNQNISYENEVQKALSQLDIYVTETDSFNIKMQNIFNVYAINFTSLSEAKLWLQKSNMKYYQNQLNFAVYCATTGCGISWNDHLNKPSLPLILSLFRFHVYFQTTLILNELECPLPGDNSFNELNNNINLSKYFKLCNEFNINPNTDFRCKSGSMSGLGILYTKEFGKVMPEQDDIRQLNWNDLHLYFQNIQQQNNNGWIYFILENSEGFTQPGIQRINQSIRTYLICVLGAQVETRSSIIGNTSTAFDAQKQFLVLFNDSIHNDKNKSIPEMIIRYQNYLDKSHVRLNYCIGPNLLIIPNDMILQMGNIIGYNNLIKTATSNQKFGINNINDQIITAPKLMEGNSIKRKILTTETKTKDPNYNKLKPDYNTNENIKTDNIQHDIIKENDETISHENIKLAITTIGILISGLVIYKFM